MSTFKLGVYLLSALLFAQKGFCAKVLVLKDDTKTRAVTREFVDYFEDASGAMSIEQVLKVSREGAGFKSSNEKDLLNKNTSAAYWLRFSVQDSTTQGKDFLIELFDFDIDEVTFFWAKDNGLYQSNSAGFTFPFSLRHLDHKNVTFPLSKPGTYYLRFKSKRKNVLEPIIRPYEAFVGYSLKEYLLFGFFYGIMYLNIFYNLLYFILLRKRYYLYYVLYMTGIFLHLIATNGIGFQYIWGDFAFLNPYMSHLGLGLGTFFMLQFCTSFFQLQEKHGWIHRVIKILSLIRILCLAFQMMLPSSVYMHLIDLLYLQLLFLSGIYLYQQGMHSTKWFLVALTLFNVFGVVAYLEYSVIIPSTIISVYAMYIGVVLQFTFISVGIAETVRKVYIDNSKAQAELIRQYKQNELLKEKVTRELEEKVKERTRELEKAKQEIEKKAEENIQMNLALDLANYKLKSTHNSFAKSVVTNTHVDFDAFKKVYPDDLACMRHLHELKEQRGFSCKMCANTKSFKGKGIFDVRCSKCNYNESITANTIFHKTKFSLPKAFYMVYLVSQTKTDFPATELAEILDLQKVTCQHFKNKIVERMGGKKKGASEPIAWDQLILDKVPV